VVVEACRECIGNACRPPPLTTTRRRSNICDLVSRRTDTATWFGLLGKKKRRRPSLCRCWRRRGTDIRKEKNTFYSNNNILWSVISRLEGQAVSCCLENPYRCARHSTSALGSRAQRHTPGDRGKLNWSGHYNNTAFYI